MAEQTVLTGDVAREQQHYDHSIESLAKETHAELDRVRELYDAEVARLNSTARIKTFVALIATRIVRETLTQHSHSLM